MNAENCPDDQGTSGEARMPSPIPRVNSPTASPEKHNSPPVSTTSSSPVNSTTLSNANSVPTASIATLPSDLKLIYINKSTDGDNKSTTSIPFANGVSPKMVQLPAGAGGSGIAYFGTIIKPGKEGSSEGQKVLLTPVIKDGSRFIVPRPGGGTRAASTKITCNTVQSPGQIIISPSQQQRRSFLIHNSALSNKDTKTGSKIDNSAIVPKVLPPPTKVPLVVCSSRSHPDVTLTSVVPLNSLDSKASRQSVDVASLVSPQHETSPLKDNGDGHAPLTPTASSTSECDDVELVSDGVMPRPISNKPLLMLSSKTGDNITVLGLPAKTLPVSPKIATINEKVDDDQSNESVCESSKTPDKSLDETCSDKSKDILMDVDSDDTKNADKPIDDDKEESEKNKDSDSTADSSNSGISTNSYVKLVSSNGHFVRLVSASGSMERDGTALHSGTIFLSDKDGRPVHGNTLLIKDAKSLILSNVSKDVKGNQSKENQDVTGSSETDSSSKTDTLDSASPQAESQSNVNSVSPTLTQSPLVQQLNSAVLFNPSGSITLQTSTPNPKQLQKSFPLKIGSSMPSDISPKVTSTNETTPKKTSPTQPALPNVLTNASGLQVKELSKQGAMMERSRKRKGAPLLRDCFKKTIAVKRLEPLIGASDYDPLKVIDWDHCSRIGTLPGSDVKFILNSWGALQVYEGDGTKNNNSKPLGGSCMDVIYCPGDSSGKDEIGRCIECECYGLLVEFIEEKFCSTACRERSQMRKALYTKRSLVTKENTSKKRKLFEIALNKTIPVDEQPQDNNNKLKTVKDPVKVKNEANKTNAHKEKVESSDKKIDMTSSDQVAESEQKPKTEDSNSPPLPIKIIKPLELNKALTKVVLLDIVKQEETSSVNNNNEDKKMNKDKLTRENSTPSSNDTADPSSAEEFDWCEYLTQMRSHPAWVRLFKDAFPSQPNLFKIGQRLEAIDPQRPSLFCAASVADIKGYRLKLHFDGYSKIYDFWVNADSPNIFPCGFCNSHGIDLEPPCGFPKETFNWFQYLTHIKARAAAPPKCFLHKQVDSGEPNLFKVGMKIEAIDKKNSCLVCVATVAAVVDHRILVHFDSWDDTYDYWTEYYSPNIHPIDWCQRNNYTLTPPKGVKKKNFSWKKYLQDTGSVAAPNHAFMVRPPIKFKKGSKLEAVDPRAPHLLRVATIKQVLPYQVHVVFDGFPDHFGSWFDDDSPDLHPISWGARTGHPLTPPPKLYDERPCVTPGCLGDGNISTGELETHDNVNDCPYSNDNLEDDNPLPDRLSSRNRSWTTKPLSDIKKELSQIHRNKKSRESLDTSDSLAVNSSSCPVSQSEPIVNNSSNPSNNSISSRTSPNRTVDTAPPERQPDKLNTISDSFQLVDSTPLEGVKDAELNAACDKFISKNLNRVSCSSHVGGQDLLEWDSRKVTSFVESILHKATNSFYNNKIDGEGLLMLAEEDLLNKLDFNESEASAIYSNITMLKTKFSLK